MFQGFGCHLLTEAAAFIVRPALVTTIVVAVSGRRQLLQVKHKLQGPPGVEYGTLL
jgi:hypothetical protein